MPDRALVQEITTVGVEATPGTAVPATVKLNGLQIDLDTELEVDVFGPAGSIYNSIAAPRQESGSGSLSGYPCYTELPYVFSNVFGAGTVTTPTGAVTTRRWAWAPSSSTPWTPRTWTIRRGVVGNTAEQAAYGLLSGVGLSFSRTATPEISGDLFSYALDYSAAIVATGLNNVPLIPVLPPQVCVYLDTAASGIGTTRLTRDFSAAISLSGLFGPVWPLDCTLASFGAHTMLKPDSSVTLQLGNDTQGREPVVPMRTGATRFLRIEATGPQIEAGPPAYSHRLRIDAALKVTDAPSRGDSDGLSTLEWTFGLFEDPGMAAPLIITLDTTTATL